MPTKIRILSLCGLTACVACQSSIQEEPASPTASAPAVSATPSPPKLAGAPPESPTNAAEPDAKAKDYNAIVAAADRSPADRELDGGRHPAQLLAFAEIQPGMRVAELAAGMGYTAELLARSVGNTGKVYGQNTPFILQRFAEGPWTERLRKPVMSNVERVDSEFDEPLPSDVKNLDRVLLVLFYHDTVWMKTDRARLNRNVYDALKPGGFYIIVDHSATAGAGITKAQELHRIEEPVVIKEVEAAGFKLAQSADFLRNPEDQRDWNASPRAAGERRGQSDRFALRFVKPE